LISNDHVVKGAAKVRLLTGAGLIDASVVKVDAANDLALLKAVGAFKPLPIAASRTVKLGDTVASVGFPIQDFMRKPGNQEKEFLHGFMDSLFDFNLPFIISRSACRCSRAVGVQALACWAAGDTLKRELQRGCVGGAGGHRVAAGVLADGHQVNYAVKSSRLLSF
jgi:hypothetical protein